MPYIRQEYRDRITQGVPPMVAGELNYCITKLVLTYLGEAPNYQSFNDVLGVLTAIEMELYRRMISKYEDTKIEQNGDVY